MTTGVSARTCTNTGFHLIWNDPDRPLFRIAKPSYGPLSAPPRETRDDRRRWGRYDTVGATLYFANSRQVAFTEVLSAFKRAIGKTDPLEADAAAVGLSREEFLEVIATEWAERNFMGVGAIPARWRHDRSSYPVFAVGGGWWVDVEHPQTISALENLIEDVLIDRQVTVLTTAELRGSDRLITTAAAAAIRDRTLDDGSQPKGIHFGSKFGGGFCRAAWLPDPAEPVSANLIALSAEPILVTDKDLSQAAGRFKIRVF